MFDAQSKRVLAPIDVEDQIFGSFSFYTSDDTIVCNEFTELFIQND